MEVFGAAMQLCRRRLFKHKGCLLQPVFACHSKIGEYWFSSCVLLLKWFLFFFATFRKFTFFLLVAGEVALHFESRASEFPLSTVCIQCSLVCVSSSVTFSFFFFIMCFFFIFYFYIIYFPESGIFFTWVELFWNCLCKMFTLCGRVRDNT